MISVPPHVSSARTRRRRATPFGRIAVHHVPFILLYVVTLKRCYETSGNPYAVALRHHLDAGYDPAVLDAVGVTKSDGGAKTRDEWGGASKDAKENEWDLGEREDEANDEERESEAEEVKYEVPPTLPAKWLPDFPDVLAFAAVAFAHALLLLAQHWSVRARCFVQYGR